ncbi:gluconate 2-dehydrogenase subunit 3 family protein [Neolewinella litorea]|uniref:Gluconate 2-dehydrogenase subunit 3 family protein n=1 Tax=Neolewinella litorea TaxID=2562452 RepID=A0A4S4NIG0_9BACT|nr:gluconate 2-dehydrogenase subunit 3 family protein [Neolewinella litorea]THH39489.1 gluconate 2-dehydrogenase subunit 3 family protein [Neolewinella litorea]
MKRRELLRYTAYVTGWAISAPVASALLAGCKRDEAVAAGEATYSPNFFNEEEYRFITKLSDTMIPTTDTPGAVDVGVPEIIDKMVGQVYDEEARTNFRDGLKELMRRMDADETNGPFSDMESEQSLVFLQDQDLHYKDPDTSWDTVPDVEANARNVYFDLKSQIVGAWFNSEPIGTEVLAYLPVPGEYIPCGDLQELTGGVAWAI